MLNPASGHYYQEVATPAGITWADADAAARAPTYAGKSSGPGADAGTTPHRHGRASVSTRGLGDGRHRLVFRASDYQEAKNMENSGPILPNTRRLSTTFVVR